MAVDTMSCLEVSNTQLSGPGSIETRTSHDSATLVLYLYRIQ